MAETLKERVAKLEEAVAWMQKLERLAAAREAYEAAARNFTREIEAEFLERYQEAAHDPEVLDVAMGKKKTRPGVGA